MKHAPKVHHAHLLVQQLCIGAALGSSERLHDARDNLRGAQRFERQLFGVGALLTRWREHAVGARGGEGQQRR
jgi:hypothetical protein